MDKLIALYGEREAENLRRLIKDYCKRHPDNISNYKELLRRIESGEPIQYVLGEAYFYENTFIVNQNVLIPRPETEELVHLILKNHPNIPLSLIDIGTGSGCIAISIKKNRPLWTVAATDIDDKALLVAENNAAILKADIHFSLVNILEAKSNCPYDIIVSNPPYIPESEQVLMHSNVLDYEPSRALFVPDESPLLFYDYICDYVKKPPYHKKYLYLEINEFYADAIIDLLHKKDFHEIVAHKDLQGKKRMVSSIAPEK